MHLFKYFPEFLRQSRLSVFIIILLAMIFHPEDSKAIPYYIYNNEILNEVNPITGSMSAADYYAYGGWGVKPSGFPPFGTESRKSFFWLYEDLNTNQLSLGMIFNTYDDGGYGRTHVELTGLPENSYFIVKDDVPDFRSFSENNGVWYFMLTWNGNTDGSVIGLDGVWNTIKIDLIVDIGIDDWYFLSGNSMTPDRIELNTEIPLYISKTPIPEPSTILLLGSGLVALACFSRKKLKKRLLL